MAITECNPRCVRGAGREAHCHFYIVGNGCSEHRTTNKVEPPQARSLCPVPVAIWAGVYIHLDMSLSPFLTPEVQVLPMFLLVQPFLNLVSTFTKYKLRRGRDLK